MIPLYFVERGYSQNFAAFVVTMVALPTALAQPFVGWLLDRLSRPVIAVSGSLIAAVAFLILPLMTSQAALLITISILGAASFSLYTAALTLLGERFRGGLLVSGSAVFALAYAIGSAAGSSTTGLTMDLISVDAGPVFVGLLMLGFTGFFALNLMRVRATRR
jgi:MFS family permease